jgi:hypothetical protein
MKLTSAGKAHDSDIFPFSTKEKSIFSGGKNA